MKFHTPVFISCLTTILLVASCAPQTAAPTPQVPIETIPEPTMSISETAATETSVSLPTQQEEAVPGVEAPRTIPISIENVADLSEQGRVFHNNPQSLVWKLDGSSFSALSPRDLVIFDTSTLTTQAAFSVADPGLLLDFSADGKVAAITTDQMSLELVDAINNVQLRKIDIPEMVYGAAFSPDGQTIAVALYDQIGASLWEVSSGNFIKLLTGFETAAPVYGISFSSDGRSLVWHSRGHIQLQNINSGEMSPEFMHEDFVSGVAVSPDGLLLATGAAGTVNDSYTPLITIWEIASGEENKLITTASVPVNLAFSPDNRLLVGAVTNTLVIWDVETGTEVFSRDVSSVSITAIAFSPDGSTLAVATADNNIQLWQVAP